jgi:putative restriction endonuclease
MKNLKGPKEALLSVNLFLGRKLKRHMIKVVAICHIRRLNLVGNPEMEAAPILPKKLRGTDHPQNGISLCRLHHWAFDNGLFSIDV